MVATTLEQLAPASDRRYLIGRCPSCKRWRHIPATAPPRCWACAGEPQPELEPVQAAGDEPARRRPRVIRGA
jgi:hypothetical protein